MSAIPNTTATATNNSNNLFLFEQRFLQAVWDNNYKEVEHIIISLSSDLGSCSNTDNDKTNDETNDDGNDNDNSNNNENNNNDNNNDMTTTTTTNHNNSNSNNSNNNNKTIFTTLMNCQDICYQNTPLHIACFNGNIYMVQLLLHYYKKEQQQQQQNHLKMNSMNQDDDDEYPNYMNIRNRLGFTPLQCACIKRYWDIAELLLSSVSTINNNNNNNNNTSISSSSSSSNNECIRMSDVNIGDINDTTPLHLASYGNCVKSYRIVQMLIANNNANVNCMNADHNTPLHLAVTTNTSCSNKPEEEEELQQNVVELLLNSGANPSIHNRSGLRPYQLAIKSGNDSISQFIEIIYPRRKRYTYLLHQWMNHNQEK